MSRRSGWIMAGVGVLIVAVGVVVWLALAGAPTATPSPEPTPSPSVSLDMRAEAQAALEEHLEECTALGAPNGAVPAGCGIRLPWGAEFASVTDVRFRIERLPELTLSDDGGFTADGGVLIATVTGTGQDGAARTETYRTESWGVRGEVESSDDGVAVTVW